MLSDQPQIWSGAKSIRLESGKKKEGTKIFSRFKPYINITRRMWEDVRSYSLARNVKGLLISA